MQDTSQKFLSTVRNWFCLVVTIVFVALLIAFLSGSSIMLFLTASILASFAVGLLVANMRLTWLLATTNSLSGVVTLLAADREVFTELRKLTQSLLGVIGRADDEFRTLALEHLGRMTSSADELSRGRISYVDTETWRITYDRLLRSPGLYNYRSVAWIRTRDYWRDPAGLHSMDTNFELVEQGRLHISRICILSDQLWPAGSLPTEEVLNWVSEQHFRNIGISLVRQSDLAQDPDLLVDFGIYGYRAVGTQQTDEHGKTSRFQLSFDFADVERYEQVWQRLQVYTTDFGKFLDASGKN